MEITLPSKPKIISENQFQGIYEIEGFHPGYGHTIGNSLRRILLSSLEGAAPVMVKIEGVGHEFSTIAGIKEDAVNIILNLKNIKLKIHGNEPQTLALKENGPREITAKDFKTPSQVEIINKDLPIATLTSKKASLNMEVVVKKGIGYMTKEDLSKEKVEIGTIVLDALFSPVKRVSYDVENMRVGERTDFNKLKIRIETDGTIYPREALEKAIGIMVKQLNAIVGFKEGVLEAESAEGKVRKAAEELKSEKDVSKKEIMTLDFSPRIRKALESRGIANLEDLIKFKEDELLELRGIGKEAIQEIKKALKKRDLSLKE